MAGAALQPVEAPKYVATTAQRQLARSPRRRGDSPRRHRGSPRRELQPRVNRGNSEPHDVRSIITQSKVDKSRARRESRESSYSNEEDEDCGAPCFSREIRETRMPKNFKLTSETPKYDGTLEPKTWLEDYLTAVRCQRGTRTTAMQYLQLHLTVSACAWLKSLPAGSIRSWEQLAHDFAKNFQATFKRPASIEELRSCKQKHGESIRAYIQRWTILRNFAEDISEESAVDAFRRGLRRRELKEELGRSKPKTVGHLMDIANRWADGEESVRDERAQSLEYDGFDPSDPNDPARRGGRNGDRRRKRKNRAYDETDDSEFVAAEFAGNRDGAY